MKKFFRAKHDRKIFGVCGGLGHYLNVDPTIIRLAMIFLCVVTVIFPVIIAYLTATIVTQEEPEDEETKVYSYVKLYRSRTDRKIAGICGGIGEITKIDPAFLRLLTLFICLITFIAPTLIAYLIGWIIIPEKS